MKTLIAMVCFMLAASPLAFAQDKAKDDTKKGAPAAEVRAEPKADKGKDAEKKSEKSKGDDKKADQPKKERTPAQKANDERLKDCNAQAGEKKGDERQKFMGACMKAAKKAGDDKKKAQQSRTGACNKKADGKKLKGDDRKGFMKECLSNKGDAPKADAPAKK